MSVIHIVLLHIDLSISATIYIYLAIIFLVVILILLIIGAIIVRKWQYEKKLLADDWKILRKDVTIKSTTGGAGILQVFTPCFIVKNVHY